MLGPFYIYSTRRKDAARLTEYVVYDIMQVEGMR